MALFDFTDIVDAFDPEAITISRFGAPVRVKGRATKPSASSVPITAVIWPSTGRESRLLPEGFRTIEARTILTSSLIRGAESPDVNYGDRFTYEGDIWEIQVLDAWAAKANYYLGVATKIAPA